MELPPGPARGPHDRGRPGDAGEGAHPPPPRGSEGHLGEGTTWPPSSRSQSSGTASSGGPPSRSSPRRGGSPAALGASVTAVLVGPGDGGPGRRSSPPTAPTGCVVFDDAGARRLRHRGLGARPRPGDRRREAVGRPRALHRDGQGPRPARGGEGRGRPRLRLRGPRGEGRAGSWPGGRCTPGRPTPPSSGRASRRWPPCGPTSSRSARRTRRGRPRS